MEIAVVPFDLLKEEMDSDDLSIRVNAIHRSVLVACAMTPEAVRSQLIPYFEALIKKEDDEVLFAIAQVLGNIATMLGGLQFVVLSCLQNLAGQEETVVRDQAVKSIMLIFENSTESDINTHFIPLLNRLASNTVNFTCRLSAVHLMPRLYPKAGSFKERLRNKFTELCNEEAPMIRRAIAIKIGELAAGYEREHVIYELIPSFKKLCSDEQDQVRLLCLDSLKSWANLLSREEIKTHMMPLIIQAQEDKSWRVRLALAKNMSEIAEAFGKEITEVNLIQTFVNILKDVENDVRIEAVKSLARLINFISVEKIGLLLPNIANLSKDNAPQVRFGAADVITNTAALVPKDMSLKLMPSLLAMITDDNQDVRQRGINGSCKFAEFHGIEAVPGLVSVLSKQMSEEKKWRVRHEIVNAVSRLALSFQNAETFIKHLQPIFVLFLKDRAAEVRELGIERLSELLKIYKSEWSGPLLAKVADILASKENSFHIRKTALLALRPVAQTMSPQNVNERVLPLLQKSLSDNVPNIRFKALNILKLIGQQAESHSLKQQIKAMCQACAEDADLDVKYFAQDAIMSL